MTPDLFQTEGQHSPLSLVTLTRTGGFGSPNGGSLEVLILYSSDVTTNPHCDTLSQNYLSLR